jgi:hypothetical protein
MTLEIIATRRAKRQADALDRTNSRTLTAFIDDLARNGCAALAYRLTGPVPLDRICVKHLRGVLRVVVAFVSPSRACILLVGRHDDSDPNRDVYAELYGLLDAVPPAGSGRGKPPCCGDDGEAPPELGDEVADLIIRSGRQRGK